jgi:hypothetical protein
MKFCPWYPLEAVAGHAPAGPGVFQVRAPALLAYPTGKTAMVHYEVADDVGAAAARYAGDHAGRGWLCRHTVEMSAADVDDVVPFYTRLVRDFRARFGCEPTPTPTGPLAPP